ncbi:hypothetical protein BKA93DRAFT_752467 [Sparassis latifolia]
MWPEVRFAYLSSAVSFCGMFLCRFTQQKPHCTGAGVLLPYKYFGTAVRAQTEGVFLRWWFRPVDADGQRVPPERFQDYRATHEFKYPGCLCASLDTDANAFTESIVAIHRSDTDSSLWVAMCSRGICGYWLWLEQYYIKGDIPVRQYALSSTKRSETLLPKVMQFSAAWPNTPPKPTPAQPSKRAPYNSAELSPLNTGRSSQKRPSSNNGDCNAIGLAKLLKRRVRDSSGTCTTLHTFPQ